ncbi:MAG: ABC transporter permease [Bryobacteraceae bacterium]
MATNPNGPGASAGRNKHGRAAFSEAVKAALTSLWSSKLRSFLTLLGIILATTTLIAVMSVIHGMDVYIAQQVSDMGANGFRVRRIGILGDVEPKRLQELLKKNPELTREEYDFLRAHAKYTGELGMESDRTVNVRHREQQLKDVQLQGYTPNMAAISNLQTDAGRFFADSENRRRAAVAVIGNDLREKFFLGEDPVGKTIYLGGRPFEVIGASKKLGSVFGQSRDNFVWIPIETYFKMFGARQGIGYDAIALDPSQIHAAQDELRMLVRAYRHLRPGEEDNFGIFASDSLVEIWNQLTGVIAATAIAIVSVFMVVGGVVIMNIMLAVVTERTHEIGIRKSVGARRSDVLNQFLVESSVLSACGGLFGVVLAWLVALVVRQTTPVPMVLPASSIFLGVGLSAAVGLFFGVYPARRAAALDPIEALRFEK